MLLQRIEIPVTDMERAFHFYADVMEFPVVVHTADEMAIFFLGDVHGGQVSLIKAQRPIDMQGPVVVFRRGGPPGRGSHPPGKPWDPVSRSNRAQPTGDDRLLPRF